jgi:hypothetical protein
MNTHIRIWERGHDLVGIYSVRRNNALKVLYALPLETGHYHFEFLDDTDDDLNSFKIETLCTLLDEILPHVKGIPSEPDEESEHYCSDEHDEWRNTYQMGIENVIECDYLSFEKMLEELRNHLARHHDACILDSDLDLEKIRNLWTNLV